MERALRNTVTFLFGDEERRLVEPASTMTVLEWLRTEALACGTKEGCAEGDCGACTVVVGQLEGDAVHYRPVNACIMVAAALDGTHLLTVEHLRAKDGTLHPVQRAMVDNHASQCGFCTPGFVMSLFALYQQGRGAGEAVEALAGNLCRCTGYRPIIDAARQSCSGVADDAVSRNAAATEAWLRARDPAPLAFGAAEARYLSPRSLDELAEVFHANPHATLLAGGTDVGLWITKERRPLPFIVALGQVAELAEITMTDTAIVIGAAATYGRCLPVLEAEWPELGAMLRRLGSRQIRNLGTIGGNLGTASPIGDMAPALLALDARLHLRCGPASRVVPVSGFFTGYRRTILAPGELIAAIEIARPAADAVLKIYKVTKRFEEDISAVCAAFHLRLRDGVVAEFRAGWGGMAATPLRSRDLEALLTGQPWNEATIEAGMRALDAELHPLSDMRASSAYRATLARNLLLKLYLETTARLETTGGDRRTRLAPRAA